MYMKTQESVSDLQWSDVFSRKKFGEDSGGGMLRSCPKIGKRWPSHLCLGAYYNPLDWDYLHPKYDLMLQEFNGYARLPT